MDSKFQVTKLDMCTPAKSTKSTTTLTLNVTEIPITHQYEFLGIITLDSDLSFVPDN